MEKETKKERKGVIKNTQFLARKKELIYRDPLYDKLLKEIKDFKLKEIKSYSLEDKPSIKKQ